MENELSAHKGVLIFSLFLGLIFYYSVKKATSRHPEITSGEKSNLYLSIILYYCGVIWVPWLYSLEQHSHFENLRGSSLGFFFMILVVSFPINMGLSITLAKKKGKPFARLFAVLCFAPFILILGGYLHLIDLYGKHGLSAPFVNGLMYIIAGTFLSTYLTHSLLPFVEVSDYEMFGED